MSDSGVDHGRRRFLTVATAVTGGVGAVVAATPFVASFKPSARAKALGAPVEVDISKLEEGALLRVSWRGRAVFIVKRTSEALASLAKLEGQLSDPLSEKSDQPDFARNPHRSQRPEIFVTLGVCTHLGCAPSFRPDVGAADLGGAEWLGGFFCPCHGSKFDLAGRVYQGVPAPLNLAVPPYAFLSDSILLVGGDGGVGA